MRLHNMGLKYNTDKATFHNYCRFYQAYLPSPEKVSKLIEIGIFDGGSLKMWEEYYSNAIIYGIDILDKNQYETERIKIFTANQSKRSELENIISKIGKVDVIIDDGGHTMEQQQISLATLITFTRYYVIEDLCTSLLPLGSNFGVINEDKTSLTGLLKLMRKNDDYKSSLEYLTDDELSNIKNNIDEVYMLWNYVKNTNPLTAIIKTK